MSSWKTSCWSSPTVDLKRRAVYVATGNAYTQPAAHTSDAVIAFDLDTGARRWVRQVMAGDAYVRDCPGKYRPLVPKDHKSETCPDDLGPGPGEAADLRIDQRVGVEHQVGRFDQPPAAQRDEVRIPRSGADEVDLAGSVSRLNAP